MLNTTTSNCDTKHTCGWVEEVSPQQPHNTPRSENIVLQGLQI